MQLAQVCRPGVTVRFSGATFARPANPLVCLPAQPRRLRLAAKIGVASSKGVVLASLAGLPEPTKKPVAGEPYVSQNHLVIPEKSGLVKAQLIEELNNREKIMRLQKGFMDAQVVELPGDEFIVSQTWSSKEAYEAWMDTDFRSKSHLPTGVCQYKSVNKWSVMEEFLPIVGDHM